VRESASNRNGYLSMSEFYSANMGFAVGWGTKESTKCNRKSANAATSCQFTLGALTEQSIAFNLGPNKFYL